MTIEPRQVKGALALELDSERVPANDFLKAAESFIGLVKEVTSSINKDIKRNSWDIEVQQGSQIINISPRVDSFLDTDVSVIVDALLHGIEALDNEAEIPDQYNERAIEYLKTLGNLVRRDKDDIPIRILSTQRAKSITRETYNHASELLSWKYEDRGTVGGVLEVVSAHNGYEIRLCEPIFNKIVKCKVSEDLLGEALKAFKQRVEVEGMIRYDKEGRPLSVKVENISVFPPPDSYPSYKELRGILG